MSPPATSLHKPCDFLVPKLCRLRWGVSRLRLSGDRLGTSWFIFIFIYKVPVTILMFFGTAPLVTVSGAVRRCPCAVEGRGHRMAAGEGTTGLGDMGMGMGPSLSPWDPDSWCVWVGPLGPALLPLLSHHQFGAETLDYAKLNQEKLLQGDKLSPGASAPSAPTGFSSPLLRRVFASTPHVLAIPPICSWGQKPQLFPNGVGWDGMG